MKPIEFPESNVVIGKDQDKYLPLPAHSHGHSGIVITCWTLDWKARLKLLLTGRIWLSLLTYNAPLQPVNLSVDAPEELGRGGTQ